jgi:hypothetical protein
MTREEKKLSPQEGVFILGGQGYQFKLIKEVYRNVVLKRRRILCTVKESTRLVSRIVSRGLSGSSRLYQNHICV